MPAALHPLLEDVRRLVDAEVIPAAAALEHADAYPHDLVARMRALGLFGALVPRAWGGLGLDVTTYARVIAELCRGWMSLAGVINSHTMAALIVLHHGTEEQRARLLPRFASGAARGGLCLTEPHAGSDVQAIRTVARRRGEDYLVTGTKMFVTNGREGNTFALLAVTDPRAAPRHRGMSCFIVETGDAPAARGLTVVKSISKLGYKGVDTAELLFEDFAVPAANLVGGVEGRGFKHVMSGLETGRINIAARAAGVGQAAYDCARRRAACQADLPVPMLADMAARLEAARLVTYWAAGLKDRAERCDLEAGMAKLYASETAQRLAEDALRLGGELAVHVPSTEERLYRDTPLMIIGEGTNEIQRTLIARQLLERHGERLGALISRDAEPEERRQIVLAVRQFVEKAVVPMAWEAEREARYPQDLVRDLADLGVLGALVPPALGGLGLDLRTYAMLVEELARGWTAVAAVVTAHATATGAIAGHGVRALRERWLPPMTRGEILGAVALDGAVTARAEGGEVVLHGRTALVDAAPRAGLHLVRARLDG
ncbi:MAG: acyl-CoA dehydrogenase family protein, partial [Candidatus Rokuibacteriota bacterium]